MDHGDSAATVGTTNSSSIVFDIRVPCCCAGAPPSAPSWRLLRHKDVGALGSCCWEREADERHGSCSGACVLPLPR